MTDKDIRTQLIDAREEYINLIKHELLGPGSEFNVPDLEHELISSNPLNRYSIGILYPQGTYVNQGNDEIIQINEVEDIGLSEDLENEELLTEEEPVQTKDTRNRNYESEDAVGENLDEEIELSSQFKPSSMGITFVVKGDTDSVRGTLSFAIYRRATITDCIVPYIPNDPDSYVVPSELAHLMEYDNSKQVFRLLTQVNKSDIKAIFERITLSDTEPNNLKNIAYRFADLCRNAYVREPYEDIEFDLDFLDGDYIDSNKNLGGTAAKITALRTQLGISGLWSITVMLVNDLQVVSQTVDNCIFQPILRISTEGNSFVFVENETETDNNNLNEEEQSLELLYRNKKIYGIGLGVSVDWEIDDDGFGSIWSDFFPIMEVPAMSFELPKNEKIFDSSLSMKYLSDLDSADKSLKLEVLSNLVELYKGWVGELASIAETLDARHQSAAMKNISKCKSAYERMSSGIFTLKTNDDAYTAFALANRAMFMQRVHLRMQQRTSDMDRYPGDTCIAGLLNNMNYMQENDEDCRWRPFQIAFLLMDVNSVVNDDSPERDIVDLIWFPTGGGKTEAYLGLAAFAIFFRRLTHPENYGGTAVMMRYTLRLLAAQQFTRAATLICACEYIRRDCESTKHNYPFYRLGEDPITIGLWIGGSHIPNTNKETRKYLEKLKEVKKYWEVRSIKERNNKFQVLKCPWCGTKLVKDAKDKKLVGSWGYLMRNDKQFYFSCTHEDCHFTHSLPIQIIDEELYQNPPSLLFGTVDKFAMLPWNGRIGNFFGSHSQNRSPELIIQDELHLISGALGTIVGLYETAVDALCSHKGVRPKIIASTATIRRAKEQCSVLYNREVVQFPAPGLDSGDSFFAREEKINYEKGNFGRKYVGLMPSGKSKAMLEIRVIAALLQRIQMMELSDEVKDKFWTLTAYFNSLRDLGKASTLVDDDIKDFIIRTSNRLFADKRRRIISPDELTSRISTTELNETLDKLEKFNYSRENNKNNRFASNVLLATSMISVGIDIARLNVMILIGQPKLTSEYIQVSSRIGRSYPGVAFVQFDATKNRDRSHYEQFKAYHESFYRFVEPTSATPFSKPARERALHAVVVSMIRHRAEFYKDDDAIKICDTNRYGDIISETENYIIDRIKSINRRDPSQLESDVEDIKTEIRDFVTLWKTKAKEANNTKTDLFFGYKFIVNEPSQNENRLLRTYDSLVKDNSIETLTSMRNVDIQVTGKIMIWGK